MNDEILLCTKCDGKMPINSKHTICPRCMKRPCLKCGVLISSNLYTRCGPCRQKIKNEANNVGQDISARLKKPLDRTKPRRWRW